MVVGAPFFSLVWDPAFESNPFAADPFVAPDAPVEEPPPPPPPPLGSMSSVLSSAVDMPSGCRMGSSFVLSETPAGWVMERQANGQIVYWSDLFREFTVSLTLDPAADRACLQDPLALLRVWSGSGLLSPWCSYCRKWMDSSHFSTSSHQKGLHYYPRGMPTEGNANLDTMWRASHSPFQWTFQAPVAALPLPPPDRGLADFSTAAEQYAHDSVLRSPWLDSN
jgi:hypothetical protein